MGTSYGLVVEITWRIEGVRQRSQEQAVRDKRFRYSGEFSGAPAGGRGQFVRVQSSRPPYPAPPTPRVRPYFSAMPESSYRPSVIQGSSSGYSGHQGQTSGLQSTVPRGCFECRDFSHVQRFCPRLLGKAMQQGQQPMITTLIVPPVVRPSRGRGQVGRGRPRDGVQSGGGPARFYVFPARPDVVASYAVITSIISICCRDASVLFDPGSTYLCVISI
ncbi:uncharacterized protein [Nicotiana tomentosiformis]|uniref:uncharacterized protein n=1 Tax=Nicotiana tomentosiformis TaxID=4098 RepID=UPI00388C88E4